jgi:hypothetical protein
MAFMLAVVAFLGSGVAADPGDRSAGPQANAQVDPAAQARLVGTYGKLPLSFEANQGQASGQVKYLSRGSGYALYLTKGGAVLALSRGSQMSKVKRQR